MTIHQALCEMKLYDKKIKKAFSDSYIYANRNNNDKIKGKPIKDIETAIKASYSSVVDLLENKKRIKEAVALSNANSSIVVGGVTYTVVGAIERKNQAETEGQFIYVLKGQFQKEYAELTAENSRLPEKTQNYLQTILGNDKNNWKVEDIQKFSLEYEKNNKYELVDPLDLLKTIESLENNLDDFLNNVDYALSTHNAQTLVEVELIGS